MTMAVEGAKQLAEDENLQVLGYELRDVCFHDSLMIPPEEDGVEVMMQFRPTKLTSSESGLVIYGFVIDSLGPGQREWRRNCTGRIMTHLRVDQSFTSRTEREYRECYDNVTAACNHEINPDTFYLELAGVGMAFGSTLRNLVRISSSEGKASCNIRVPNTAATMPENLEYPHAIHPALLESLIHVMIPAVTGPKTSLKKTLVPKFIDSVYISNDITADPSHEIQGYATARWQTGSLAEGNIVALDSQKNHPLVIITQMQCKTLPTWDVGANDWQPAVETSLKYRKLCSQMEWKIDQESFHQNETVDLPFYLECLFHTHPSLKVLQLGGDPADVTSTLLRVATLDSSHAPLFSSLVYTATSAKAIADAGVVLAKWSAYVQFEILNIEEDLIEQNFEPHTYDLVIADATIQTPNRMRHFMSQIKALMKPKGALLIEGDVTKLANVDSGTFGFTNLKFGDPIVHPVILETWKILMMEHGFASGPMLCKDTVGSDLGRTLAATANNDGATPPVPGEAIIIRPVHADQEMSALMTSIVGRLSILGFNTAIVDMYAASEHKLESYLVVNMVEIKEPLLSKMGLTEFEAMKSLVLRSKYLLWITMGGLTTGERPDMNMASGFGRTMRHETDSANFATLDLGSVSHINQTTTYNDFADAVGKIALLFCEETPDLRSDREFAYHDRHIYVPRVRPLEDMNNWMNEPEGQIKPERVCLDQIGCPILIARESEDSIEDLYFMEDPASLEPIGDNHVQIDVKASAFNTADLVSPTENLGLECAGVITKLGKNVCHLRIGDRVMVIGPGCHRTRVIVSETLCQRFPESLSFYQGASIPLAYCTAYLALVTTANVKVGERILIHESPDGFDQAAAEIALHHGAEVFILTNSLEKRAFMIEQLKIAENHVLAIDHLELSRSLMRLTNCKGVDVIVGYAEGEIMRQSWHCIAPFGRYVDLHTCGGLENTTELDMRPFRRSATFSSVDVIGLLKHRPDEVSRIFRDVRCFLDQGSNCPIAPITSYNYSRVSECFKTLLSGSMRGKTILSAEDGEFVPVCRSLRLCLILSLTHATVRTCGLETVQCPFRLILPATGWSRRPREKYCAMACRAWRSIAHLPFQIGSSQSGCCFFRDRS